MAGLLLDLDADDVRVDGEVVADVAAGAVPGDEDAGEVPVGGDPGVGGGKHPLERGEAVVVPRGERVLGRQAVVDGDDERGAGGGQPVEVLRKRW
jgi:hypothetical protein